MSSVYLTLFSLFVKWRYFHFVKSDFSLIFLEAKEKGEITVQPMIQQLETELNLTDEDEANLDKERLIEEQLARMLFLKTEMEMVELDAKIKTCLTLEKADTESCLVLLDYLLELPIKSLMLLKYPSILESVRHMRYYVGNNDLWRLSDDESCIFAKKAEDIRQKANKVYDKFKDLFPVPEGLSFWEYFNERATQFKKCTAKLDPIELRRMVQEPLEMSIPTLHSMRSAIDAANEVEPLLDDGPVKKKNPAPEKGEITVQPMIQQLETELNLTDEDEANLDMERLIEEQLARMLFLKTEMEMVELDAKIKTCLTLEKADTESCLVLLDYLLELPIKSLMLLKYPSILESVRHMRYYVGNNDLWRLSDDESCIFAKKAEDIRQKANKVYDKFKDLFPVPEGLSFWEYFNERATQFKKCTAKLDPIELRRMVQEPLEMSIPTLHSMRSAIDAANEVEPLLDDGPVKKKNPAPEKGEITVQPMIQQLETELNLTDEDEANLDMERLIEEQLARMLFLKTEMEMVELDAKIKTCLTLEKADTESCLVLLDYLLELPIKSLMLLKYPSILESVRHMRYYVGNNDLWRLSDDESCIFAKKAEDIRQKANKVYDKFKDLFPVPEGLSFWEYFNERATQFKKCTAKLDPIELRRMVQEPLEMSIPTLHSMRSAIDAANEVEPLLDDGPMKKKNPAPEKGEITVQPMIQQLETESNLTDEDEANLDMERLIEEQLARMLFLKTEMEMVELDAKIKTCLTLEKADTESCLVLLDYLLELPIKSLMLLKYPSILESVRHMRYYVGNNDLWRLSDDESCIFAKKAEDIRQKANKVYDKFKDLFPVPEGLSFWEYFNERATQFKKCTAKLDPIELRRMVQEPLEMSIPTLHSMRSAIDAANEVEPLLDDGPMKKKNPAPEKGEITVQPMIQQLETELNLTDEDEANLDKERLIEEQLARMLFLKTEMEMVELDTKIKTCLTLEKADTESCLVLLDYLLELPIKSLMLLKYPSILESVRHMRYYVGNNDLWRLSDDESCIFAKKAEDIRQKANKVYDKFKDLFPVPEGLSFWEYFNERATQFKKCTAKLDPIELRRMVQEPLEMSIPTLHSMRSAIDAANEVEPLLDDGPMKKKNPAPVKRKGSQPVVNTPNKISKLKQKKQDDENNAPAEEKSSEEANTEEESKNDSNVPNKADDNNSKRNDKKESSGDKNEESKAKKAKESTRKTDPPAPKTPTKRKAKS